ncbi:regulatory protein RecX [Microbacterium lacticum]
MSDGDDRLAPVIPLFGGAAPAAPAGRGVAGRGAGPARRGDADVVNAGGVDAALAPDGDERAAAWHPTWTAQVADLGGQDDEPEGDSADESAAAGEAALLRKLRTRSLSVREARGVLREREVDEASSDEIVERFVGLGYLDDAKLAEQLVHTAVDRKGQGRRAVSQTLSQRGIPREVVDAVLAELPDDEFERALDFARQKARSMRDLDREVALRRLSGQLARRGYGGGALAAARQALDEASRPQPRGVRFDG